MTSTRSLVFGDDGSPAADIAWLFVNDHAWAGWRLEIVHAQGVEIGSLLPTEATQLHAWDPPVPRRAFAEAQFSHVEHLTTTMDPRLALSRTCDLLVIGPRGPGLLKALHLGSTADWLLLHPPAPLLIARHGRRVRSVVLCADGSLHAAAVADALATLPWADQLDVTVLTVDDGRTDVVHAADVPSERLRAAGANVTLSIASGKPTKTIHEYLEKAAPDLVALGTRGLTGLAHLRVGSTAGAIARAAGCSVLVACDEEE